MMPTVIDLRPNKHLLNPDFEKYQYSSEIIPITEEKSLSKHVFRREASSEQDSWLEAKLFAFHNHLYRNPFDSSCWFYDENYQVWQMKKDGTINAIYTFNLENNHDNSNVFNPTISFASDEITILTRDDNNLLVILNSSTESQKSIALDDIEPGILLDSCYIQEKSLLVTAMCCIIGESGKKLSKLVLCHYSIVKMDDKIDGLELLQKQELTIKGPIEYVYIESTGDFINLLSQDTAKFTFDSLKKIQEESLEEKQSTIKIPKYSWSQDEDSLTVWVKIPQKHKDIKPKVKITATTISVMIDCDILIQGESQFRLDQKTAVWNVEQDTLKLELLKHESGQMWTELIMNDTNGECLANETLAAEIHSRLSHLCTEQQSNNNSEQPAIGFNSEQLEECDLEGGDNTLQRIDLKLHSTTHLAMLGSHNRVLFTHKLKACQILCTRHDHDGCVWKSAESTDVWDMIHTTTFPGFGYVEASKSNKKFCISPPNTSYVAIIEHTRHGFLYEKPGNSARVAKQRIIDLGTDSQPIMGAVATNEYIILLTKDKLYQLKIT